MTKQERLLQELEITRERLKFADTKDKPSINKEIAVIKLQLLEVGNGK